MKKQDLNPGNLAPESVFLTRVQHIAQLKLVVLLSNHPEGLYSPSMLALPKTFLDFS